MVQRGCIAYYSVDVVAYRAIPRKGFSIVVHCPFGKFNRSFLAFIKSNVNE